MYVCHGSLVISNINWFLLTTAENKFIGGIHHRTHRLRNVMTSTQSQNKNKTQGSLARLWAVESIWPYFIISGPEWMYPRFYFFQQKLLLSKSSICSSPLNTFSVQREGSRPWLGAQSLVRVKYSSTKTSQRAGEAIPLKGIMITSEGRRKSCLVHQ